MKIKNLLLSLAVLLSANAIAGNDHSTDPEHYYLNKADVPSSLTILMYPPDTTSARFAYDREQYEWGKTLRNTPRGQPASSDANLTWNTDWADDAVGEAFGIPITKETSPALYKLL